MTRSVRDTAAAATGLLDAEGSRTAQPPLTQDWPDLDLDTAYAIQDEALAQRLARGEHLVGIKLGLTSRTEQRQMGVSQPVVAFLTDAMVLGAGVRVPQAALLRPRVQPQIVFVMAERLSGPGATAAGALRAVGSVHGGLEILDSRYTDSVVTLPDVIADNASSGPFVTGSVGAVPAGLDLSLEACLLEVDGRIVDSATGAATMGNPLEALALAANLLARRGLALEAGWIVLTGGLTDAVAVAPGAKVAAHFTHLGSVVLSGG